jgi:excisionase family DNA binding protein
MTTKPAARQALATPVELSAYLEIPEATIRIWRHRGVGPRWVRVGRHIRYRWTDVEEWLDRQSAGGDAA